MAPKFDAGTLAVLPRHPARLSGRHFSQRQACCASSLGLASCQSRRSPRPRATPLPGPLPAAGPFRTYATTPPRDVAVLGGGLTGLTAAYYLARFAPETKVTLYEASDRLGGWIDSERVGVRTADGRDDTVLFERGARTVQAQHSQAKWDDLILYELIDALGLKPRLVATPRQLRIPRYIYYPDHIVDVTGPQLDLFRDPVNTVASVVTILRNLLTEPVFEGIFSSVWHATYPGPAGAGGRVARPQSGKEDVSVGEFFLRKFGRRDVVDNILSALMHGTQGGDVWKLSAASSMFQRMVAQESLRPAPGTLTARLDDVHLLQDVAGGSEAVRRLARDSAYWGFLSFDGGFATLTDALAAELARSPNVTIRLEEPVTHLENKDGIEITTTTSSSRHDKVVSTLLAGTLASVTGGHLPSLAKIPTVTMWVVNLWYPADNLNAPHHGFGYLLPQSVPAANNPEAALGVLFDSDREAAQFSPYGSNDNSQSGPGGTKLTIMLGGHLWDDLPPSFLPDEAEAIAQAKAVVKRHLGIDDSSVVASAKLCRDCIPQHHVGHASNLGKISHELTSAYGGALAVAGGSYSPPGVLPALRAGRDIASEVAGRKPPAVVVGLPGQSQDRVDPRGVGPTGLARATEHVWTQWPKGFLPLVGGRRWESLDKRR